MWTEKNLTSFFKPGYIQTPRCLFSAQLKTLLDVYYIICQHACIWEKDHLSFHPKNISVFGDDSMETDLKQFSSCDTYKFVTVPKQMLLCDENVLDTFIFNAAYLICIFTMCKEV